MYGLEHVGTLLRVWPSLQALPVHNARSKLPAQRIDMKSAHAKARQARSTKDLQLPI